MKKCSTSLIIREIKTRVTSYQSEWPPSKSLQIISAKDCAEKRKPSYTVDRNANLYSHYGEQYRGSSENYKTTIWSSNPTLWHISRENHTWKGYIQTNIHCSTTYNSQEIKAWIKKMWYLYTMEYYSTFKKSKIMPFAATWIDLEMIILSEVSQRKTNIIWYHICEILKNDVNELIYKTDPQT